MASLPEAIVFSIIAQCGSGVDPITTKTVINVESASNPYAIALVNSKEEIKQPKTEEEAVKLANDLERKKIDFSAGLMQINKRNFKTLGLTNESVFNSCNNVEAGTKILKLCYLKAQQADQSKDEQSLIRDAMSCYYSGNFTRGYKSEIRKTEKGDEKGDSYIETIEKKISTDVSYVVPRIKKISGDNNQQIDNGSQEAKPQKKAHAPWDVYNDF